MASPQTVLVDAPPRRQRPTGLFKSFPPEIMVQPKERNGVDYFEISCEGPSAHQRGGECPTPERVEKDQAHAPYVSHGSCLNLSLISGVNCETVGDLAHLDHRNQALFDVASAKLVNGAAYALGQTMSTGMAFTNQVDEDGCLTGETVPGWQVEDCQTGEPATPFCLVDPEIPCVDPVTPTEMISSFEGRIGDCTNGQPVIYLPAVMAALLVTKCGPVVRVGNSHETAGLGTPVVFGYGFMGWSPEGEEPEDGCAWGFMGGAPRIRRGGLDSETFDLDSTEHVNVYMNDAQFWVEEDFTVGFDPCCGVAQYVKLCG